VPLRFLIPFLALLVAISLAQDPQDKTAPASPAADKTSSGNSSSNQSSSSQSSSDKSVAPDSDAEPSSSRDTRIDLTPPKDDAKDHPESKSAVADLEPSDKPDTSGVQEFHPWNPMKAVKDLEVGDFYFKRKNYKAALERYKEALYYKDGDAVANFRVAECEEKLGDKSEARKYYEQYLKILPDGPRAKEAHSSLERLAKAR
jgi:tetratricopeptide (TPR) repeat protein